MTRQPADARGEHGAIVNTASVAAEVGQAAYSASKTVIVG
jgi:NAD(P)-dependent dehydrogenase (short-subunit alcohol dehydrogenase family)